MKEFRVRVRERLATDWYKTFQAETLEEARELAMDDNWCDDTWEKDTYSEDIDTDLADIEDMGELADGEMDG